MVTGFFAPATLNCNALGSAWSSFGDARLSVFQYIETFYNQRSHQTLHYLTPIQFEAVNQQANAA